MNQRQQQGQPFDWRQMAPSDEDFAFASDLCRDGVCLTEIHEKLVQRGVRQEFAREIVAHLTADHAAKLFIRGLSASQVVERLMHQGLSWKEAEAVTKKIKQGRSAKVGSRIGLVLFGIGCLLIMVGVVVEIGERSELFPTIPFAGKGLIALGVLIVGLGGYWIW
jgi:hypothetical protein